MTFRTLTSATAITAMLAISSVPALATSHATEEDGMMDMDGGMATDGRMDGMQAQEDGEMGDADGGTMMAGTEFTDEQLDAFVTAAMDMREIREDYAQQIAEAADESAAEALVIEAQEKMLAVVEETDSITPEEYVAIGSAAQTDAELAARLSARFEAEMQVPGEDGDGEAEDDS